MLSSWRGWVPPFYVPPEGDPFTPPKDGKCPINDLPDELLSCIFQFGVDIQQEEWEDGYSSGSEDADDVWEDVDESENGDEGADDGDHADSMSSKINSIVEPQGTADVSEQILPFQVLVSHVCRHWRCLVLDIRSLWTTLAFGAPVKLERAEEYILRSSGLPLNIVIDCSIEDEDLERQEAALFQKDLDLDTHKRYLSLADLDQILELLGPEVDHWGRFIFYASTYDYVERLMYVLHLMPAASLLESFQVYIYSDDCDDYEVYPGTDSTSYLPFEGEAPYLREAVFWGVHINWDDAAPNFLHDLRELELSYLTKDVRPSYSTFAQIIKDSPQLRTLSLTLAGPVLEDGVAFDSEEGWGSGTLDVPSLREFALQFHPPPYASALIQHLNMPNVTNLVLNFDEGDYSDFVQTLAHPIKSQKQSLLQHVTHLKISGLPCNVPSVEALLSQLTSLQSLNIKLFGAEEDVIFAKLVEPNALPTDSAQSVPAAMSKVLPKVFCPKLEEVTTSVDADDLKRLIISRREAGAPLKKINLVMDPEEILSTDDECWIRDNVEELNFYEPSDSEEEVVDSQGEEEGSDSE